MVTEIPKKADAALKETTKVAPKQAAKKPEVVKKPEQATICIKQIGSSIRRDPRQALYLRSLGLGKLNRVRQVVDNPSTRGLLDKLRHMVVVIEQMK